MQNWAFYEEGTVKNVSGNNNTQKRDKAGQTRKKAALSIKIKKLSFCKYIKLISVTLVKAVKQFEIH